MQSLGFAGQSQALDAFSLDKPAEAGMRRSDMQARVEIPRAVLLADIVYCLISLRQSEHFILPALFTTKRASNTNARNEFYAPPHTVRKRHYSQMDAVPKN